MWMGLERIFPFVFSFASLFYRFSSLLRVFLRFAAFVLCTGSDNFNLAKKCRRAKRSTTTAREQNRALVPQVYGRHPYCWKTKENHIYLSLRGIVQNFGAAVVVDSSPYQKWGISLRPPVLSHSSGACPDFSRPAIRTPTFRRFARIDSRESICKRNLFLKHLARFARIASSLRFAFKFA